MQRIRDFDTLLRDAPGACAFRLRQLPPVTVTEQQHGNAQTACFDLNLPTLLTLHCNSKKKYNQPSPKELSVFAIIIQISCLFQFCSA